VHRSIKSLFAGSLACEYTTAGIGPLSTHSSAMDADGIERRNTTFQTVEEAQMQSVGSPTRQTWSRSWSLSRASGSWVMMLPINSLLFANQRDRELCAFCFFELKIREALLLLSLHCTLVSESAPGTITKNKCC
jgi:hypothetical protein